VIVVTLVAAAALFGVDAISAEIEDPFGTDMNDLPIEYFCRQLKEDIEYMIECASLGSSFVADDIEEICLQSPSAHNNLSSRRSSRAKRS